MKKLIVIGGLWGTGKTTLARQLGNRFGLPVVSHDCIKESLFDVSGLGPFKYCLSFDYKAYRQQFKKAEEILNNQSTVILEAMFDSRVATRLIQGLIQKHNLKVAQFFLVADKKTRFDRCMTRSQSSQRHRMHADNRGGIRSILILADRIRRLYSGYNARTHKFYAQPLQFEFSIQTTEIDTSNLVGWNEAGVFEKTRDFLNPF